MASMEPQPALRASLFDRLIDPESDGNGSQPGCTLEQLIDSVRRDLEDLLNTHRTTELIPPDFVEVENSIVTFGLPDLSSYQSTKPDVASKVGERIEKAIARFEPRLRDIHATLIDDPQEQQMKIKFQISATLRVDPSPEVAFVTILKLSTGETSIQRADT